MADIERERDLVLNPNEYAYVLDKTKGLISCVVGSYKMSLSTSDSLVVFNEQTKRFQEASYNEAVTTFISAPENWYIELKNPAENNKHPVPGSANSLPELQIGRKINIKGNTSFALYPGQMGKAIKGHTLRSNQYILARVYDANYLNKETIEDPEAEEYTTGQLLIIKGTEVPFYIPETGIEVVPDYKGNYVRDAVTLERLEYCILKNEEGDKKYVHGPAVVFPKPDETFIYNDSTRSYKFKAIELSEISGIYVKVIADYEEDGKAYDTGDELFITGKDQMIYYPRPEHAIIDYDGKIIHHAIAIPVGEGRYVLNRKTGDIKTVKGPAMYLPDPRNEVIVNRKLTKSQCELWYPGNEEVLKYNNPGLFDSCLENGTLKLSKSMSSINTLYSCVSNEDAVVENSGFSRGSSYTKPRTITLDNKYNGVVSIDIWTGYAINVISKNGTRKVVTGPQTCLLDYDQTLEVLELSTGKPKTTDNLLRTVYLRTDNNKISDIIKVQTKDFVDVQIKVSYCVDFLEEYKNKWFSVDNYVKYLTDRLRSLIKREVKNYNIEEFYNKVSDIVRNITLDIHEYSESEEGVSKKEGRLFKENGMFINDVEVLSVDIDSDVENIITSHQRTIIEKSLELSSSEKEMNVITKLAELDKTKIDIDYANKLHKIELESKLKKDQLEKDQEVDRLNEKNSEAKAKASKELQPIYDAIHKAELARTIEENKVSIDKQKQLDDLKIATEKARTEAITKVMESITPDLIASMTSYSNAELLKTVSESMSPYAIANGESVSEVTNKLLRGTALEGIIDKLVESNND